MDNLGRGEASERFYVIFGSKAKLTVLDLEQNTLSEVPIPEEIPFPSGVDCVGPDPSAAGEAAWVAGYDTVYRLALE